MSNRILRLWGKRLLGRSSCELSRMVTLVVISSFLSLSVFAVLLSSHATDGCCFCFVGCSSCVVCFGLLEVRVSECVCKNVLRSHANSTGFSNKHPPLRLHRYPQHTLLPKRVPFTNLYLLLSGNNLHLRTSACAFRVSQASYVLSNTPTARSLLIYMSFFASDLPYRQTES